jgi:hypothetical protein
LIAALRKSGVLPILIWLFAFPVVMVVVALMDKREQEKPVIDAIQARTMAPAEIRWSVRVRGWRYQRRVCVASQGRTYLVRLARIRQTDDALLRRWTVSSIHPAAC